MNTRNIFRVLLVTALVFTLSACKKDKGDAAFKLDGINLNGVKYLALGSHGGNAKGQDTQQMLYSIDESGNMQLVAYNYQCDDDGLVTEIQRNIGITITQIVPVGEKYIWLVGCRYYCDDYSGFSESMQSRIRDMVQHSIDCTENFLIRKSDGKIFDLNGINAFPLCVVNVPGYGNAGVVGIGGRDGVPLDGDITGDRLRKLGLICQHNDDIFLASGAWNGGLSRLHDNGSSLSVIDVLPGTAEYVTNFAYAITDNNGHLGTCISYGANVPHVASIMASDGTLPRIPGIPVAPGGETETYWPEMRCIGGKFFVSVHVDPWDAPNYDSIYRVDINGTQVTSVGVAAGRFTSDNYSQTTYISDEETYSWYNGTTLYTFNANTYELTESSLPAGWPEYSMYDAEGHYYESHLGGEGLQSFTIYNLATLQTEEVTCNRSEVPAYNMYRGCYYDGGMKAFVESVILANGSSVTIVTPVTGSERGISRVQSQTEANNNVVVGTLIPLN
ncbi:MAG: hypothetical protein J5711_10435 [Bacteroidales bacterium]|nr:hypothetical protein [Bacteroidales bacterium]